ETPLHSSKSLSELLGCRLLLKAENLQRTGSFKVRGAAYRMSFLSADERRRGVIAASAGNHAQGVALAAQDAGVPCMIVMPQGASIAKVKATQAYGAAVDLFGHSFDEAMRRARELARERGLTLVHAFDDPAVVAGQGTLALELCRQTGDLDLVVVPVGGGGLIAGMATVLKTLLPKVRVIGVQAEAAPAVVHSFAAKEKRSVRPASTIADGIAVGEPGELPWRIMRRYVDDVVAVPEEEIAWAMVLLLERAKLLVEGAGAVGLAALLGGHIATRGQTTAVVLTGGNIDPLLLSRVLDHGLARQGRFLVLWVPLSDVPGQLAGLLSVVAETGANVVEVIHQRRGAYISPGQALVELIVETRDAGHASLLMERLRERGYEPLDALPRASTPEE
ncbi:MAG: threonine ammonia-lyase, partial [Chloroflexi bacterium]|nr:threonine ammonia-lyase [Chloroflexota bacterium]